MFSLRVQTHLTSYRSDYEQAGCQTLETPRSMTFRGGMHAGATSDLRSGGGLSTHHVLRCVCTSTSLPASCAHSGPLSSGVGPSLPSFVLGGRLLALAPSAAPFAMATCEDFLREDFCSPPPRAQGQLPTCGQLARAPRPTAAVRGA